MEKEKPDSQENVVNTHHNNKKQRERERERAVKKENLKEILFFYFNFNLREAATVKARDSFKRGTHA